VGKKKVDPNSMSRAEIDMQSSLTMRALKGILLTAVAGSDPVLALATLTRDLGLESLS
jgi:hypothetical protein